MICWIETLFFLFHPYFVIHCLIYYYHCCCCYRYLCIYLGLVGRSNKFSREQVAPSSLRSLGFAFEFLQFQAMLLFAKALCYSLHQTSSASLSIFSMSLLIIIIIIIIFLTLTLIRHTDWHELLALCILCLWFFFYGFFDTKQSIPVQSNPQYLLWNWLK